MEGEKRIKLGTLDDVSPAEPANKTSLLEQILTAMIISRITLFALPAFAVASAIIPRGGTSCSTGPIQCCASTQSSSNLGDLTSLLGLLGINVSEITGLVGVTCNPITVIGTGTTSCTGQTVCCQNNSFNGVVALGCTPINLNL